MRGSREATGRSDEEASGLRIEIEGRGRIAEISASARRVPWLLNALQILWVAGPATFIAMQGGYLLGFGEFAPARNVIYFVFFTLFLGLIGLGSKLASVAVIERREQEAAQKLRRTIDLLPDLLFAIRDTDLAAESLERRRRLAAGVLLQELDLGPETLALAVSELSGDTGLSQMAQQIEVYRRFGLHSRVRDLVEASAEARLAALERVHAEAPELADALRERLQGNAPRQDDGIPRREGFLQRLLAAADQDDPMDLPVSDVQELIVLAFELLSGREIRYLHFTWKGRWGVARALDAVEITRARYRLAQARVDGRLRSLGLSLVGLPGSQIQRSDIRRDPVVLAQKILDALERLIAHRPLRGTRAARRLGRVLNGVRLLRDEHDQWLEASRALDAAIEHWEARQQKIHPARRRWWHRRPSAQGLHIQEDIIALTDDAKLAFARGVCNLVDDLELQIDERGLYFADQRLDRDEIRRLGLQMLAFLQDSLDLTDLAIQRAIQASPAAWLGGMQADLSAEARAGLGAAVVKEVRQDLGRMAERLAAQLSTFYHLPLDPALRQQLVDRYGANPERLEMLASRTGESGASQPIRRVQSPAREKIMRDPRWVLLLKLGERYAG